MKFLSVFVFYFFISYVHANADITINAKHCSNVESLWQDNAWGTCYKSYYRAPKSQTTAIVILKQCLDTLLPKLEKEFSEKCKDQSATNASVSLTSNAKIEIQNLSPRSISTEPVINLEPTFAPWLQPRVLSDICSKPLNQKIYECGRLFSQRKQSFDEAYDVCAMACREESTKNSNAVSCQILDRLKKERSLL